MISLRSTNFLFAILLFCSSVFAQASKSDCEESAITYYLPCELQTLWESMTLRQKAAQMIMVYMSPADFMVKNEFGGYLVMKNHLKNLSSFKSNIQEVNQRMNIPPLVAVDQEGGKVNRVSAIASRWNSTPSAKAMRNMRNDEIEFIAKNIAVDMKSVGINVNLAPVLDPATDGQGRKSFMEESDRSWGDDTTNANKIRSFVAGMRRGGVVCVSKHFPGYDSGSNSDLQIAISETSQQDILKNVEVFEALANDIPITMLSSVRFAKISDRPAVFDPEIVQMARNISPETVILTDDLWGVSLRAWISSRDVSQSKTYPEQDFKKLVQTALTAGNDMFMITYPQKAADIVDILVKLAEQDASYAERIEESAARILKLKFKAGILKR